MGTTWSTFTYPLELTTGDGRRGRAIALGGDDQLLVADRETGQLSRHPIESCRLEEEPGDEGRPDTLEQPLSSQSPVTAGS